MLKVENLSVSYGAIRALDGVSVSVKRGGVTAILGANGAGKTTLLSAISGLVKPKGGRVLFEGKDIAGASPAKIARQGVIQSPEGRRILVGLTVEENLKVGAYSLRGRAGAAAREKNLARVYGLFPRLKERHKQQANTLSGGEQQMLAIGRALMSEPKLLVLDEPSLGLAPLIVKEIFRIVAEIQKEGSTILIVEQNALQTLKIADYAYVLELGKVGAEGPAAELVRDKRLVEAYLGG
ncbi:MAG: ABC transporter ATP-binding protein [Clostridiales bacterium]|nr:ABC transporter ATP-binding protein [Clostridiales bacterium]